MLGRTTLVSLTGDRVSGNLTPPPRVLHDGQQGPRATIYAVSAWVAKGPWGLEAPMDLTARQQEDTVVLGSQPAS